MYVFTQWPTSADSLAHVEDNRGKALYVNILTDTCALVSFALGNSDLGVGNFPNSCQQ